MAIVVLFFYVLLDHHAARLLLIIQPSIPLKSTALLRLVHSIFVFLCRGKVILFINQQQLSFYQATLASHTDTKHTQISLSKLCGTCPSPALFLCPTVTLSHLIHWSPVDLRASVFKSDSRCGDLPPHQNEKDVMNIMTSEWFAGQRTTAPRAETETLILCGCTAKAENLLPGAKLTEQEADTVKLSKAGGTHRTAKRANGRELGWKRKQENKDGFNPAHKSNGKLQIVVETLFQKQSPWGSTT